MSDKKQVKTLSFRADPETLSMIHKLKEEMSLAYGVPISNSDLIRKALATLEVDWIYSNEAKNLDRDEGWKE